MAYFKPDRYFSRLSQISIEKDILGCGFENVLLDIDNTFVPRDTQVIPRDARVWLGCAREAGVAEVLIEGKPGAVPQKELFTLLCGLQMPLMRLTPAADTLEDVFLRCTADDQALEKK